MAEAATQPWHTVSHPPLAQPWHTTTTSDSYSPSHPQLSSCVHVCLRACVHTFDDLVPVNHTRCFKDLAHGRIGEREQGQPRTKGLQGKSGSRYAKMHRDVTLRLEGKQVLLFSKLLGQPQKECRKLSENCEQCMVYNVCYMTSSIVLKQCVGGEGGGSDQAMLGNGDRQPSFSGNPE